MCGARYLLTHLCDHPSYVYYRIASEWSRIKQRPGYAEMKQQLDTAKQESVRTMLCRKAMAYLDDAISIAYRGKQPTSSHDDDGDDSDDSDTSNTSARVKGQCIDIGGRRPLLNRNLSIRCFAPTWDRSGYRSSLNLSMDECDELLTDGKNSDDTASSSDWNSDQEEDKAKRNAMHHDDNEKKAEASKRVVAPPSLRRMSMDGGSTARRLGGDQQRTKPTATELVMPPANGSAYVGGIDGAPDVYTTTDLPAYGAVDVGNTARLTEVDEVVDRGIHEAWDALGDCHLLLAQRSGSTLQVAQTPFQSFSFAVLQLTDCCRRMTERRSRGPG